MLPYIVARKFVRQHHQDAFIQRINDSVGVYYKRIMKSPYQSRGAVDGLETVGPIGSGSNAKEAWIDAAKRLGMTI